MKKYKRITHILLSICLLFTMEAGLSSMNNTVAAMEKNFKTLTLKVNSCNTYFYLDDSEDFTFDYDKTLFEVDVEDDDSNRTISISKKEDAEPTIEDKVSICIPDSLPFDKVIIENESAGMSLCEMNKPITIKANKGAIVIPLPKDFSKSLNVTAVSSGVVIKASKKTGINFTLKAKKSSVALPKSFPTYVPTMKEYSYTYKKGTVDITTNLTTCSFVLSLE